MNDWIQTYTGKKFWPLSPNKHDIDIRDIAHALSLICRFGGHCVRFYSVAEHSVRASFISGSIYIKLCALLHDSEEAYLLDIPSPVKNLLSEWDNNAYKIRQCIFNAFNIQYPYCNYLNKIKNIDRILLATEKRDLMNECIDEWDKLPDPLSDIIIPWDSQKAENWFLSRFYELLGKYLGEKK